MHASSTARQLSGCVSFELIWGFVSRPPLSPRRDLPLATRSLLTRLGVELADENAELCGLTNPAAVTAAAAAAAAAAVEIPDEITPAGESAGERDRGVSAGDLYLLAVPLPPPPLPTLASS